jgi:transcriptional regulator with XRE-family HTH domain
MPHYTSTSQDALVERVTSDFIGQIAQQLEKAGISQSELAEKLGVSDPEVSQVLNLNRINLTLKLMTRYAFASGLKVAVVAYDDGDPTNQNGPIGSEIFSLSWEKLGKPRDVWAVNEANCATRKYYSVPWRYSCTNSTLGDVFGTTGERLQTTQFYLQFHLHEKATSSHAGNQELYI